MSVASFSFAAEDCKDFLALTPYINWAKVYNPASMPLSYGEWAAIKIRQTLPANRKVTHENEGKACALFFAVFTSQDSNDIDLDLANNILELVRIHPLQESDSFVNVFKSFARSKLFDALLVSYEQSQSIDEVYDSFKGYLSIVISNPHLVDGERIRAKKWKRKNPVPGSGHFKIQVKKPKLNDDTSGEQLAIAGLEDLSHLGELDKADKSDSTGRQASIHSSSSSTSSKLDIGSLPSSLQPSCPQIQYGSALQSGYPSVYFAVPESSTEQPYVFLPQGLFIKIGDKVKYLQ